MCGIVAIASTQGDVVTPLLNGLEALEYRGYDSSGLALVSSAGLFRHRAIGKVQQLRMSMPPPPLDAHIGIGHTRWAVVGAVTECNAHPQSDGQTVVVHNGIVENFHELKALVPGVIWESDTDTEVIVHLITKFIDQGLIVAVQRVVSLLKGTFAIVVAHRSFPNTIIAVRHVNPLSIGKMGNGDYVVASDIAALPLKAFVDLDDGEMCVIHESNGFLSEFCAANEDFVPETAKHWVSSSCVPLHPTTGEYPDFTIKEIHEQPDVVQRCIDSLGMCDSVAELLQKKDFVNFIGCGSSFYAGLVGKYWLERYARLATSVEISSEFNYRDPVLPKNSLNIFISQSGETLDTLRAIELVRRNNGDFAVMTNVPHSTMGKITPPEMLIELGAGPERSVVSTKAFIAQLAAIATILISYLTPRDPKLAALLLQDFERVPQLLRSILSCRISCPFFGDASSILYLGRGPCYPVALEGALKLKEITYLSAEGYPGGEMKHGPIALIDPSSVSIVLAPSGEYYPKILSNVQEILARGGLVTLVTDHSLELAPHDRVHVLPIPQVGDISSAFVCSAETHVIAYNVAKTLGLDTDRPRNLAKSVTVE